MLGLDAMLATADVDAAAAFYTETLGGHPRVDASPWRAQRAVSFGAQVVAFRPAAEPERSMPKGIYDAIGLRVLSFLVADLDATCARLEARGRRVARGVDLPGRRPIRFARDPDGNTLELIGVARGACPSAPLQVGLTVRDAEASRAFYGGSLGLRAQAPAPISPGITRWGFDVGDATLKLWQPLGDPAALPRPGAGRIGIEAVGIRVAGAAATRAPAEDPDGNRVEWIYAVAQAAGFVVPEPVA